MKYAFLALLFACCIVKADGQYKNDNVLFTTVYPEELCGALEKNKGYLLLDVRSPGEHYDTSSFAGYNFGHLKGAKNINIPELGKRLSEISGYKDKPVFVYCSHSQRSRRASKMLTDSGFTKVYNINGGMTAIHYLGLKSKGCLDKLVESSNTYKMVSAYDICHGSPKNAYFLDVRSDSAWDNLSRDMKENYMGYIRGAHHIALDQLESKISTLPQKEIVITDVYGDQAAKAAYCYIKMDLKMSRFLLKEWKGS
jgi:rhodanese-related sulfurtransferase